MPKLWARSRIRQKQATILKIQQQNLFSYHHLPDSLTHCLRNSSSALRLTCKTMAFLLNKTAFSALRSNSQKSGDVLTLSRRGFHVELGAREKALLAEHPALRHFKSTKKSASRVKLVGDYLTVILVAGFCYEIYVKTMMREESRQKANESA